MPELGGQLTALYPEKYVYDVAGHPKILAKDLAKNLATQAQLFKPSVVLGEKVLTVETIEHEDGKIWKIQTDKNTEHYSKTILLALGAGACVPKKLDIDMPEIWEEDCVFYAVKSKDKFKDKNVLIVGGGDSAVDWANEFSCLANKVTLIHRRDQFRAVQSSVEEMKRNKVDIKTFYELKEVKGNGQIQEAVIFDNRTGKEETLKIDRLLMNVGFVINLDFLRQWGIEMEKNAILVNEKMETNVDGILCSRRYCRSYSQAKIDCHRSCRSGYRGQLCCGSHQPTSQTISWSQLQPKHQHLVSAELQVASSPAIAWH